MTEIPKLPYFYDREKELNELQNLMAKYPIIVVHGIAGIGKTCLIAKFMTDLQQATTTATKGKTIFWYNIKTFDSVQSIIRAISEFLLSVGKKRLASYLKLAKNIDLLQIPKLLTADLKNTGIIFVFDDFHFASESIITLFRSIKNVFRDCINVKLFVIARDKVPFYDRREVLIEKLVAEFQLEGLDKTGVHKLLERKATDISDSEYQTIYELTHGHPLFIELIATAGGCRAGTSDILKFIHEEILANLSRTESNLLKRLVVYRTPVPPEAFVTDIQADYTTLFALESKALIRELIGRRYYAHELIRNFIYELLTPVERKQNHIVAAEYYKELSGDHELLERIYHLIKAEKFDVAIQLLVKHADYYIDKGFSEELMAHLNLLKEIPKYRYDISLNTIREKILDIWDGWDTLLEYTVESYYMLQQLGYNLDLNIIHQKYQMGKVGSKELEFAIEEHKRSLDTLKNLNDIEGMIEVLMELGWLYARIGKPTFSEEVLQDALNYATKLNKRSACANLYVNLGSLYLINSNFRQAREYYEQAIEIWRSAEEEANTKEIARATYYLGHTYLFEHKIESAIDVYRYSIELANKINFIQCEGYGLLHEAEAMLLLMKQTSDFNLLPEIDKCLIEAYSKFDKIDDLFGKLYVAIIQSLVYLNSGLNLGDNLTKLQQHLAHAYEILPQISSEIPIYSGILLLVEARMYKNLNNMNKSWLKEKEAVDKIFQHLPSIQKVQK